MNITKDKEINGLYIRHGKRGDVWNYVRNKQGKLKRASLGPVNTFTVAQARQWALELHEGKEVIADAATFTLAEVVDRAVEEQRQRGNRQPEYLKYWMTLHCKDWLPRPLSGITRLMIRDRHALICGKKGFPASGRRWVVALGTVFKFAKSQLDYEGENKAQGIKTTPPRPRQVVWTQEQLTAFMAAAERDSECWHSLFTVMAGTGMRRNNVCRMEWSEITGDVWTIPAAKFKTKVKHSVHLTPTVMAALERRRGHHERWVFPSISMPDRPHAYPSRQFQRICKAAGVSGVTMHDLRRTLGSRLAARFPIPVVAKILGHKNISTTMSTYAVADDGDARAAMMALAAEQ